MTSIYAIVNGTQYLLSGGQTDLCWVEEMDDVGMPPVRRLTTRASLQNGDTDVGFRLDPRLFALILGMDVGGNPYTKRSQILSIFKPRTTAIILRWVLDDASIRQIDCHYAGNLGMRREAGTYQQAAVLLRAADPTFYDPTGAAVTFALGGGTQTFTVPTPVPTAVGASTIDSTIAIDYPGTWDTQPHLIRVTGPITNAVITNTTTGDVIQVKSGTTIAAADYYDIDPRWNHATCVNSSGTNKIADLEDADDLTVWHLAADPDAPDGINSIRVTGSGVTDATKVEISYLVRYVGV
jgi:hypothetical protein